MLVWSFCSDETAKLNRPSTRHNALNSEHRVLCFHVTACLKYHHMHGERAHTEMVMWVEKKKSRYSKGADFRVDYVFMCCHSSNEDTFISFNNAEYGMSTRVDFYSCVPTVFEFGRCYVWWSQAHSGCAVLMLFYNHRKTNGLSLIKSCESTLGGRH